MSNKVTGQFGMSCDILGGTAQSSSLLSPELFSSHLKSYRVNGMENSGNLMLLIYAQQEKQFQQISMIRCFSSITIKLFFAVCLLFEGGGCYPSQVRQDTSAFELPQGSAGIGMYVMVADLLMQRQVYQPDFAFLGLCLFVFNQYSLWKAIP